MLIFHLWIWHVMAWEIYGMLNWDVSEHKLDLMESRSDCSFPSLPLFTLFSLCSPCSLSLSFLLSS